MATADETRRSELAAALLEAAWNGDAAAVRAIGEENDKADLGPEVVDRVGKHGSSQET
jgi:hypothetical protein